jgi:DNA-binding CsgD family transcriptional regulator
VRPAVARLESVLLGPGGALHLGPLGAAGVADWLGEALPAGRDEPDAEDLARRTSGWPELVAAELAAPGTGVADLARARLALLAADHQRIVRALAFGLPAGAAALAQATEASHDEIDAAVAAALDAGLLHDTHPVLAPETVVYTTVSGARTSGVVPAVAAALRAGAPAGERVRVAAAVLACGPPDLVVAVARGLAEAGDRSAEAGAAYERAADALLAEAPAEALELFDAAIRAGRPAAPLGPRRAVAALAAGRPEQAVTLAHPSAPSSAGAGWAHMGAPDLAGQCYASADGDDRVLAVLPLLAAGRTVEARQLLSSSAPGSAGGPAGVLAEGVARWAEGDGDGAFELLERSAQLAQVHGGVEDWPDSPHAVLAAAAAQWLDTARAERVARTAVERAVGGQPFATRHRLFLAWAALRAGRLDDAREALDAVPAAPQDMVRDTAVASALAAAIALRTAEPEELPRVHREAARATCRSAPDPFAPDLAGELAHLAARVGDDPEPILGPLDRIATSLGDPPTLTVPVAWARLMVAVASDDAPAAGEAAERLATYARDLEKAGDRASREATTLLTDAARTFADVLGGRVDAGKVRAVADRLTGKGLVFEASRLVGAASLRCDDAAATRALLGELRRLRSTQVRAGGRRPKPAADLSEREREVARALLEGHTHREIGARLYISAKTVEHHVARIRQKLGATTTRADLLASIRDELERTVPA